MKNEDLQTNFTDEEFDEIFDTLFDGVESLKNDGSPGTLIPLSSNTRAVLCSEKSTQVIMVMVRFGHGRCLVFSHNNYSSMFFDEDSENLQFIKNCRQCLSPQSNAEFISIDEYESLEDLSKDKHILVWNGNMNKNEIFIDALCKFVEDGGSLICSATAWACVDEEENQKLSDLTFSQLCDLFGVKVTSTCIDCPDWIPIDRELIEFKNLQHVIEQFADDPQNDQYLAIVARATSELNQLIPGLTAETVAKLIEYSDEEIVPDSECPIKKESSRQRSAYLSNILCSMSGIKAPGVEKFPGDFEFEPRFENNIEYSTNSNCRQWFCTGYYVAAGVSIRVDVLEQIGMPGWSIRIGCHNDELDCCDELRRWSCISTCRPIDKDRVRLSTAFGGILFLESPNGESNSITVRIRHVVRTPVYDLMDADRSEKWQNHQEFSEGLWADISGEHISFNLPSKSVIHMEAIELDRVLQFWDRVVLAHHELRGTEPKCRERIVCDEQPSVGYMHSGYPIVTHMNISDPNSDDFVFNMKQLKKHGAWGLFHELGHNMQRDSWTFDGTEEVTVNLFTLHAMEKICKIEPWIHPWLQEQIDSTKEYIENGCVFDSWKDEAGVALFIYAQLIREFGWDSYKAVFRLYEEKNPELESDQDKIDHWIITFSQQVDRNLIPLFRFWGFPISNKTINTLQDLEIAVISDEFIELAAERFEI